MKKPHVMLAAVVAALVVSSTPGISQQVSQGRSDTHTRCESAVDGCLGSYRSLHL